MAERPAGLAYRPALLGPAEQRALIGAVAAYGFRPVVLHGQAARRTAAHFGVRYGYESREVVPGEPLPPSLLGLRDRCAGLAGLAGEELVEALVTHYPPGATIGWHRDAPMFGPVVVGVSLGSPCLLRFQRRTGGERRVYQLTCEPGSAYVLTGSARAAWQHAIPPVPAERWSVTFRTLRAGWADRRRGSVARRRDEATPQPGEPVGEGDGGAVGVAPADDLHADR